MEIQSQVFHYLVFVVFYLFFGVATSATQNVTSNIASTTSSNLSKSGDGTSGNVLQTARTSPGFIVTVGSDNTTEINKPITTIPYVSTSSTDSSGEQTSESSATQVEHVSSRSSIDTTTSAYDIVTIMSTSRTSQDQDMITGMSTGRTTLEQDVTTGMPAGKATSDQNMITGMSTDRATLEQYMTTDMPAGKATSDQNMITGMSTDRATLEQYMTTDMPAGKATSDQNMITGMSTDRATLEQYMTTDMPAGKATSDQNMITGMSTDRATLEQYMTTGMPAGKATSDQNMITGMSTDRATLEQYMTTDMPAGKATSDQNMITGMSTDRATLEQYMTTGMPAGKATSDQNMITGMSTDRATLEQYMTTGMPAGKATLDQNMITGMSTDRATPDKDIFTGMSAGKTTLIQDTSTIMLTGETIPISVTSTLMSTRNITIDHNMLTMMSKETTTSPQEAWSISSKETTTDTPMPDTDTNTGITLSPTKVHGNTAINLPTSNVSKDTTTDSTFTSASQTNASGTYTQTLPRDAISITDFRVTTVSSYDNISEISTETTKQVSNINTLNIVTGVPEANVTNRPNDTVQPSLMPGRTSTKVQTTETLSGTDEVTDSLFLNTTSANTNVGLTLFSGHATTPMPLNNSKMVNNSILPSISTHEATLSQVSTKSETNVTPTVENSDVNGASVPMTSYFMPAASVNSVNNVISNVIVTSFQVTHIASDTKVQLISPTTSYNMAFSTIQTSTTQRAVTADHMTSLGISNETDNLMTAAHPTLISASNEITVLSLVTSQSAANLEADLTSAVALTTVPNAHGSAYSVALSPNRTGSIAAEFTSTRLPTEESTTVVEISLTSNSSPVTKKSITTSSITEVISTTSPSTIKSSRASLSSEALITPTPSTVKSTIAFGISSSRGTVSETRRGTESMFTPRTTTGIPESSSIAGEITTSTLNLGLSTYSSTLEIHSSKSGNPTTELTTTTTAVIYRTTADVISTSLLTSMNLNIISPSTRTPITSLLKSSSPMPASTTAMVSSSSSTMSNGLSSISTFASVIPTTSSPAAGIPALSSRTTAVPTSPSTSNALTPSGPVAGIPTTSNSTPRTPTTVTTSRIVSPLTVSPAKLGTSSHPMSRTSTPASKNSGVCDGNPCGPLYNCVEDDNSYQCTLGAAFIVSVVLPLGILLVVVIALLICVVVLLRRSLEKRTSGANDSNDSDRNTENNELIDKPKDDREKSTDQLECNGLPPVIAPTMPVIGDVVKKPVLSPILLQGTSDPTVNMVNETTEESTDRKRHKKKKRKERKRKDEELSDLNTSPSNANVDEVRVPADVPMMLDAALHSEESAPKKKKHKKHKNKSEKSKMDETPDLDEIEKQQPLETEEPLNSNPDLVSNQKIQEEPKAPTDVSPVDDQIMSGESDVKKKHKKHKKHKSKKYKIHPLPLNDTEIDIEPPLVNVAVPLQESENGVDKKVVNTEQATEKMEEDTVTPSEERSPHDDVTVEQEPSAPEEEEERVVNTEPVSELIQTGSKSNLINDENGLEDEKTEMVEMDQCDENSVPIEDETTFTNNDRKESKDDELFYKRDQDKEKVKTPRAVSPAIYRELVKRQRKINITHRYATMDV